MKKSAQQPAIILNYLAAVLSALGCVFPVLKVSGTLLPAGDTLM